MLKDKKFDLALVTGATSGIGEALCALLAEKGISLIITGRDAEKLTMLKEKFAKKVPVMALKADLVKNDDRSEINQVIKKMTPDLVINNAGFGLYGDALDHPVEKQLNMFEVNSKAYLEFTLTAIQALLSKKKCGTILNVSSVAAYFVFPGFSVYAASKACVNSFSESLDYEYKSRGIRILAACPGYIKTNFGERAAGHIVRKANKISGMDVDFAAQEIWSQIQSGKSINIFNWKYRLAKLLSQILPKSWIAPFLYREMLAKKNS